MSIWLAMISVIAGTAPRYGNMDHLEPGFPRTASPRRNAAAYRGPAIRNVYLPGLLLTMSISSGSVLAGKSGRDTMIIGCAASRAIDVTSFRGSKAQCLVERRLQG
jgi:hypothetical protein